MKRFGEKMRAKAEREQGEVRAYNALGQPLRGAPPTTKEVQALAKLVRLST